jgi:hypothetical protein
VDVVNKRGQYFELTVDKPYGIFFTEQDADNAPFATIRAKSFALDPAIGETCEWSFEQIAGDEENPPITLYLEDSSDSTSAEVYYSLNGGTGEVTYRATLTAGGFSDSVDITAVVKDPSEVGGLPSGITVPRTEYVINPGQVIKFQMSDIAFATGQKPEGSVVNKWYETYEGDWNSVDITREGTGDGAYLRFKFNQPARCIVTACISVNNCLYSQDILVTVQGSDALDPGFDAYLTDTLYLPDEEHAQTAGMLGDVYVNNVALTGDETYEWSIEPVGDSASVLAVSFDYEDQTYASLGYSFQDTSGDIDFTPEYIVRYTAADGLYEGETHIFVNLLDASEDLGDLEVELPAEYEHITLAIGEEATLDEDDLQLVGGDAPPEDELIKSFSFVDDDDRCDWDSDGSMYTFSYNEAGEYTVRAEISYRNYVWSADIPITVEG